MSALEVGQVVAEKTYPLTRDSLVRYAGASGDFNPIHYRDDVAAEVGLPGVLAHGMLTMGIAVGIVSDALGDPGLMAECGVKFTRPVIVDAMTGADIHVRAEVGAIDDETARVDLTVRFADTSVLGKAQVRVRVS